MHSDPSISRGLLVYDADGGLRCEASIDEAEDGGGQFTETLKNPWPHANRARKDSHCKRA